MLQKGIIYKDALSCFLFSLTWAWPPVASEVLKAGLVLGSVTWMLKRGHGCRRHMAGRTSRRCVLETGGDQELSRQWG